MTTRKVGAGALIGRAVSSPNQREAELGHCDV
jgi:hypothetical protein